MQVAHSHSHTLTLTHTHTTSPHLPSRVPLSGPMFSPSHDHKSLNRVRHLDSGPASGHTRTHAHTLQSANADRIKTLELDSRGQQKYVNHVNEVPRNIRDSRASSTFTRLKIEDILGIQVTFPETMMRLVSVCAGL
jgi:hypothetical protein